MERVPGHSSVLHTSVSSRSGQEAPASFASLITSRPLFLLPPPQVRLHLPQGFQSPTLQSTGNVKLWWEIKYLQWWQQWLHYIFKWLRIVVLVLWVWCFWWWWFSWLLFSLFDWFEITNCSADSIKVGFNDGVVVAFPFHCSYLSPCVLCGAVLQDLE